MEGQNESRINIEDLPKAEQELTAEEAKEVKGGTGTTVSNGAQLQLGVTQTAQRSNTYGGVTEVKEG